MSKKRIAVFEVELIISYLSATEQIGSVFRLLCRRTVWKTVVNRHKKKVAALIHHSAHRHFCFSSSRLFSRIICHDSSRCIPSPSPRPSFLPRSRMHLSNHDAEESSSRSPFASALAGRRFLAQRECNASATQVQRIIMRWPSEAYRCEQ